MKKLVILAVAIIAVLSSCTTNVQRAFTAYQCMESGQKSDTIRFYNTMEKLDHDETLRLKNMILEDKAEKERLDILEEAKQIVRDDIKHVIEK